MRLTVLYELRQGIGGTSQYDLSEDRLVVDSLVLTDLRGTLWLLRTDRGLLATVKAEAKEATTCSRCLRDIECPVTIEFKEEYLPYIDPRTQARVKVYEGEEPFRIDEEYVLDLTEALRQYILTSEPSKPLCKADCAGLCPECGADLNESTCECAAPTDERWAALTALKEDEGR